MDGSEIAGLGDQISSECPHRGAKKLSSIEAIYELKKVRTLHAVSAERWIGQSASAYWCEWDHWGETARSLSSIISNLEDNNWRRLIRPGSCCLDIGAHSGDTAVPMGLFAFDRERVEKGVVVAVEPNPEVFEVLAINIALNSAIANFISMEVAITAEDVDQIELADHGNANCNGGILQGGYSTALEKKLLQSAGVRYLAKGISLETLIKSTMTHEQISNISFIKTDLEGYDKNVIRSAASILQALKPNLFIEWFAWFTPEDDDDLFRAIDEAGYVPLHPNALTPIDRAQRTSDLVCIHRTKLATI